MKKTFTFIFYSIVVLTIIVSLIIGIIYNFNSTKFLNTLISLTGILIPFAGLFLILFKELKKLEYKRYKYTEAYFITLLIMSVGLFYIINKKFISLNNYIYLVIYIIFYLSILLFYIILDYLKRKKDNKLTE